MKIEVYFMFAYHNNNKKYITLSTLLLPIVFCAVIIHFMAIAAGKVVAIMDIVMADRSN